VTRPEDPGAPISYAVLATGTPVYSADGIRIGAVAHVLAAEAEDIFDGIVIDDLDHHLLRGHDRHRFVDAPEVAEIHERAVLLTIDAAACRALPAPSANPAEMEASPTDTAPAGVSGKLRRAWDLLSGNY
jgi:hypothetical protein